MIINRLFIQISERKKESMHNQFQLILCSNLINKHYRRIKPKKREKKKIEHEKYEMGI